MLAGHKSHLAEVIRRFTDLPIVCTSDGVELVPKTIYVLPEDHVMTIKDSRLRLRRRRADEIVNHAIDIFFCSLAAEARESAIGVVLSGAGEDGLKGAEAIKAQGGTVIAQTPRSAPFAGMPESLITKDHPDYILSPDAIAHKIIEKAGRADVA